MKTEQIKNEALEKKWRAREIPEFDDARFWKYVSKGDSCWDWNGSVAGNRYGTISIQGKNYLAHRVSYKIHKGQPDISLVIDHICRNRRCVNPEHLREVNHKTNALENSKKADLRANPKCRIGHNLDADNSYINKYGAKDCRKCKAERELKRRNKKEVFELRDQLKDRDQEIERLKRIEQSYKEHTDSLYLTAKEQLKERDELIRDLRSLGTCDIDCDGMKCSKTCKKKSMIFEKARKLTEEVK